MRKNVLVVINSGRTVPAASKQKTNRGSSFNTRAWAMAFRFFWPSAVATQDFNSCVEKFVEKNRKSYLLHAKQSAWSCLHQDEANLDKMNLHAGCQIHFSFQFNPHSVKTLGI